jgi:hypothetical protein
MSPPPKLQELACLEPKEVRPDLALLDRSDEDAIRVSCQHAFEIGVAKVQLELTVRDQVTSKSDGVFQVQCLQPLRLGAKTELHDEIGTADPNSREFAIPASRRS